MGRWRVGTVRMAVAGAATIAVVAAMATPAAAAGPVTPVVCTYQVQTWLGGFTANVSIDNHGATIDGWALRWTFHEPTIIGGVWSAVLTQNAVGAVAATNLPWNGRIATGQTTSFGWSAVAAATSVPTDLTINGHAC